MKKKSLACLLCSLLVVGAMVLAGCGGGNSDADAISKDLASQLDSFKSSSSQQLADALKANDSSLSTLGIDTDELSKSLFDGFTYSVDTVTVSSDSKSATAEVSLTSKTATSVLAASIDSVPTVVGDMSLNDLSSEDAVNKLLGKLLTQAAKSAGTETVKLTVTYSKTSDGWKLDDLETQIYKALGLDQINLDSIYRELGVSNAAELDALISQYLPK